MRLMLRPDLPPAVWPAGIVVRTWQTGDERAIHELMDIAYAGDRNVLKPFDAWREWFTGDPDFDPASCFLAFDGPRLAGLILCWRVSYVKDLCVAPEYRRLGLGRALVVTAARHFVGRGETSMDLKADADNRTGALELYAELDFTIVETFEHVG